MDEATSACRRYTRLLSTAQVETTTAAYSNKLGRAHGVEVMQAIILAGARQASLACNAHLPNVAGGAWRPLSSESPESPECLPNGCRLMQPVTCTMGFPVGLACHLQVLGSPKTGGLQHALALQGEHLQSMGASTS